MSVAALVFVLGSTVPAPAHEPQLDELSWLFSAQVGYGGPLDKYTRRDSPPGLHLGIGAEWSDGGADGAGVGVRVDALQTFGRLSEGSHDDLWAIVAGVGFHWRTPRAPRWMTRLGVEFGAGEQIRTYDCMGPDYLICPSQTLRVGRFVLTTPVDVLFRVNRFFALGVSGRVMLVGSSGSGHQDSYEPEPVFAAADASLVAAFTIAQ